MKIVNNGLANTEVALRTGLVQFDERGIADIQPDDFAEELLQVPGFYRALEIEVKNPVEIKEGEKVVEAEGKNINDMTGKELDELAKQLGVEDYPKGANVPTRRAAIGTFINDNAK